MADTRDELHVYEGVRPQREGDMALESQGMAPIPVGHRYGGVHRMFTVWFNAQHGAVRRVRRPAGGRVRPGLRPRPGGDRRRHHRRLGAGRDATYASDYSRCMKPDSSKAAIFWLTLAGLTASYVWVEGIGLAGASVLGNQTAALVAFVVGFAAMVPFTNTSLVVGPVATALHGPVHDVEAAVAVTADGTPR